jgi:Fur family transcriptional regulator, ferric uptake regulator
VTVSHTPTAPGAVSFSAALTRLRTHGLRVSAARRLVLEALFRAEGPVSAEVIAGGLGGRLPGSDLASVYRNLDTLEAAGLAHHLHLGQGPGLYARAGGAHAGYAACERCGGHVALQPEALAAVSDAVRAACGYAARFTHFPIVGVCAACEGSRHAHP